MNSPRLAIGAIAGAAVLALGAGAASAASSAAPAPKSLSNPTLTGFQLIQRFENKLAPNQASQLASFLSGSFIIRRSDGATLNRAQYLQDHPYYPDWQAKVYEAEYQAPVLTVQAFTWTTTTVGQFNPGLFSFAWINGGWRMTGFAKFATQSTLPATG